MSRVLQAVDSIHQVGIYCLALVPPNYLPKVLFIVSAVVTVDSSHMTASSSALWNRFSPPSNFVNGHGR